MRYLVLADLHHDFWEDAGRDPFRGIEAEIAGLDLLILAGDVSNKPKVRWKPAFEQLCTMIGADRIKVFPGNHDFYQYRLDAEDRLAEIAAQSGVEYVARKSVILGNTRFLCTTLWTDFELGPGRLANEAHIPQRMNDYRAIRVASGGFRKARPRDFIERHFADRAWLSEMLKTEFSGQTFVVSHHAPHPGVLVPYGQGLEAAYASNMEEFMLAHKPDQWIFGHCHDALEISVGSVRLRNASLGYPDDVRDPQARILSLIRET